MTPASLIQSFESCRLKSYKDGGGVWTIGWGHTHGVHGTVTCTQEQADQWFKEDLDVVEGYLRHFVKVEVNENQWAALMSLAYNIGVFAFKTSTLLKHLNDGYFDTAAEEFLRWNKDNGHVVDGLSNRRAKEREIFLTPTTQLS